MMNTSFCSYGQSSNQGRRIISRYCNGIKSLAPEKSITQEDFFNDTGIHISIIETGKVNVSISTLKSIVGYFDISLALFFQAIEC